MQLDVFFTPAEFETLLGQRQPETVCVVFDILRATSTIVTALVHGARAVRPVTTIKEAVAERDRWPDYLLAGERGGLRIGPEAAAGVDFDLGNSPREFTSERVAGRTIVLTTTNGTRALRACAGAGLVLAGAFLNLAAVGAAVRASGLPRVLAVCSGTGERVAYEDALAAGAFCAALEGEAMLADGAALALSAWRKEGSKAGLGLERASNARRLRANPDLSADLEVCLQRDTTSVVPVLYDGVELRWPTCRV